MKDEIICNQEKEDGEGEGEARMGRLFISVGVSGSEREGERHLWHSNSLLLVSTFSAGGVARALRGINNLDCTRLPFFPLIISVSTNLHQVTKLRYMYIYDEG